MRTWFERLSDTVEDATVDLPCFVVGEVAQAHDGSLGMAHAFIDAIADAGADAVKFQTHIASAESTDREPWRVRFSLQDATRRDYWRRMEFQETEWAGLKAHAESRGLQFLSSPFSMEAVDLLERLGVPAWKVASGEVTTGPLLDRMLATRRPILLSTGMSTIAEIDALVARIRRRRAGLAILQCTTAYPCPPERVGLNLIPEFEQRYACPVGLSDHSGTIFPGLAAAALGARIVEVHVTLSREMFGPDVAASVTTSEFATLIQGVRAIERMLQHPVCKDTVAGELSDLRRAFSKAVVARTELRAGTLLTEAHLALKKPAGALPASALPRLIGLRLRRDMAVDEPFEPADLLEIEG